jgi:HD-GYP domain-containing protein (c-di-GMP phosphodiesterase class II)
VVEREGVAELRVVGDFFFLNETRLRLDLSNFSTFGSFAQSLAHHGLGGLRVHTGIRRDEWAPFLSLILRPPATEDPYHGFLDQVVAAQVDHIEVRPETERGDLDEKEAMAAAKRTYAQGVKCAKDALEDVRLGRAANVRQLRRSVQTIVDRVLENEPSMITLTTLRDYDDYTFTHSVNVCIFSVVMGQRLQLEKPQLFELGLCGLLHDIGKMRLDPEVFNKPGKLDKEDWAELRRHPTEGLLILFHAVGFSDVPYRQMLAAYEHHMGFEATGYPTNKRPRRPSLFSRIVAVADGFDAGTSVRSYQHRAHSPDKVLSEMRENPGRGFDPLLVKVFISATGVFPIGTLVILDTYEMAVVSGVQADPSKLHLPRVKIIADPMGIPLANPTTLDLSLIDPSTGKPSKQIVKTTDPQRYGIRVADYLT